MNRKLIASLWAAAVAMAAGPSAGQATFDSAAIAQPHLLAARKLAAEENNWRHPALVTCYPFEGQVSQNVNKNLPGAKVFDNLYYVGDGKYGPYAIDTRDGIILIDAMNSPQDVEQVILPNMRRVGLDPARLKVLIISHGHGDHFGGARYLQETFGVRTYLSGPDWDMVEAAGRRPNNRFPVPRRDIEVKDGDTITLGEESIRVFLSPGHTAASLTMLIPVRDRGQPRLLAYLGGVTNREIGAEMHAAFDRSAERQIKLFTEAKVDGLLSAHPNYDDAVYKLEQLSAWPDNPNPFLIGTANTVLFVKVMKACNLNNAMLEKAMPTRQTRREVRRLPSIEPAGPRP